MQDVAIGVVCVDLAARGTLKPDATGELISIGLGSVVRSKFCNEANLFVNWFVCEIVLR